MAVTMRAAALGDSFTDQLPSDGECGCDDFDRHSLQRAVFFDPVRVIGLLERELEGLHLVRRECN